MSKNQFFTIKSSNKYNEYKEYKEIFDLLDKNNERKISISNLFKIRKIFFPIDQAKIKEIINTIDTSKEGELDLKKFILFIQKQKEYIQKTDEKIILKSLKEEIKNEFLGNKRKRGKIDTEKSPKYNEDKNFDYPKDIFIGKEKEEESEKGTNYSSKFHGGVKIKKLDGGNDVRNNKYLYCSNYEKKYNSFDENESIKENNFHNYNSSNKRDDSYIFFKNDNNDKRNVNKKKRKNTTKKGKNKNNVEPIIIYKKDLPFEIIRQFSHKSNDILSPLMKIENNCSNGDKIENIELLSKNVHINQKTISSLFSSPFESQSVNSLNNDSIKNIKEYNDYINSDEISELKKVKIFNNVIDFNHNQSNDKNNYLSDYKQKHLDNKFDSVSNNNSIYFVNKNNNNSENSNCFSIDSNINLSNYKMEGSIGNINNIMTSIEKENESIISSKKSKSQDKTNSKNIQILNDFLLIYKRNKKNVITIKKSIEIPYAIIINKKVLNMSNINSFTSRRNKFDDYNKSAFPFPFSDKRENILRKKEKYILSLSQMEEKGKQNLKKNSKEKYFKSQDNKKNKKKNKNDENNNLSFHSGNNYIFEKEQKYNKKRNKKNNNIGRNIYI